MSAPVTFLVCEDGREYIDRFQRLFAATFQFARAGNFAEARAACVAPPTPAAILLDLDFRRTPPDALVDEAGASGAAHPDTERRRLSAMQGILILRALRADGVTCPALLFADLDDPARAAFLESSLAPLQIVPSSTGARDILDTLDRIAAASPRGQRGDQTR